MTLPRYWTDPRSGVDYARGERILYTEINSHREAATNHDAVLERFIANNWSFDGYDSSGAVSPYSAKLSAFEPLARRWVLVGDDSGTPQANHGFSPKALIYDGSMPAGAGLTPLDIAVTTRTSSLSRTMVVCGTPGSSSNQKYRYSTNSGQTWSLSTSSATSTASVRSVCWHIDRFVSGGDSGAVEYSTTGASFSAATPANSNTVRTVRSNGVAVIGVSTASTNKVTRSLNGVSWSESTLPATITARSIVWVPQASKWVIYGDTVMMQSSDGISWTSVPISVGLGYTIASMLSTGNLLVASETSSVIVSDDLGANWREVTNAPSGTTFASIAAGTDSDDIVGQLVIPAFTDPTAYSLSLL